MTNQEKNKLFDQFRKGDEKAFERIFNTYYSSLCLFSNSFFRDREKAEEIVQDFFVKFWSKREKLSIDTSLRNYLFRSVKNHCLNQLQHEKVMDKYVQSVKENFNQEIKESDYYLEVGLSEKIAASIESLPEKRRKIFKLSREEGLKYQEIAEQLGLSVKTVEAHMGLALKQLREKLDDYKDYWIGLVIFRIHKS